MDFSSLTIVLAVALPLFAVYQLGSVAGIYSERSGVANVAIEGNMIIGAVIYAVFFQILTNSSGINMPEVLAIIISVTSSMLLSATYMLLLSHATNKYMADHIIVGTGMNLLAPALAFLLYFLLSPNVPELHPTNFKIIYGSYMNVVNDGVSRPFTLQYIHIIFVVIAIAVSVATAWLLNETRFGLRLRSSGENPYSLETAGVSVAKTRRTALYIAGMLSSLAGIAFTTKGTFFFTVNGSGFIAIGIMLLGQYRISGTLIGSLIMSLFIGFFETTIYLTGPISNIDFLKEFNTLMKIIPFIIPLIGLMIFRKSYVPKSVGKNFKKDQR